ncbi:hypothetical protein AX16_004014 [Volvariella volvacea WC 439]|nr:hypothetical protein AX16_004014 [Volvariella volvacea WC 439]
MAAHFLCCLPLRLGVFIIGLLQFAISGVAAGLMWYAYYLNRQDNYWSKKLEISVIVYASIYTLIALVSFFGWLGSIIRKHGFVRAFSVILQFALGFQIGATIYFLVLFFSDKEGYVERCINGSTNEDVIEFCEEYLHVHPAAVVIASLIPIFIQAYAVYVVSAYAKKLANEKTGKRSFAHTSYQPVGKDKEAESHPLNEPTSYPYSDQAHSFGSKV